MTRLSNLDAVEGYAEAMSAAQTEALLLEKVASEQFVLPEIEEAYRVALSEAQTAKIAADTPLLQDGVASVGEKALKGLAQIEELQQITGSEELAEARVHLLDSLDEVRAFYDVIGATSERAQALKERLLSMGGQAVEHEVDLSFGLDIPYELSSEPETIEATPEPEDALGLELAELAPAPEIEIAESNEQLEKLLSSLEGKDEPSEPEIIFGKIKVDDKGITLMDSGAFVPYNPSNSGFKDVEGRVRSDFIKRNAAIVLLSNSGTFLMPRKIAEKISELTGVDFKFRYQETTGIRRWLTSEALRTASGEQVFVTNGKQSSGSAYMANPLAMSEQLEPTLNDQPALQEEDESTEVSENTFNNAYPQHLSGIEKVTYDVLHTPLGDTYITVAQFIGSENPDLLKALRDFGFELKFKDSAVYRNDLQRFKPERSREGVNLRELLDYRAQACQNLETLLASQDDFEHFTARLNETAPLSQEILLELRNISMRYPDQAILSQLISSQWVKSEDGLVLIYDEGSERKVLWPIAKSGDLPETLAVVAGELEYNGSEKRRTDRENTVRRRTLDQIAAIVEEATTIFINDLGDADGKFDVATIKEHLPAFTTSAIKRTGLNRAMHQNVNSASYSVEEVVSVLVLNNQRLAHLYKTEFSKNQQLLERVMAQAKTVAKQNAGVEEPIA